MVNPTFPTQSGTLRHFPLVLLVLASQNGLLPCVQRDDNYSMKEGFAWSYKTKFVQFKDLTNAWLTFITQSKIVSDSREDELYNEFNDPTATTIRSHSQGHGVHQTPSMWIARTTDLFVSIHIIYHMWP